jgi:uncharacterized protein YegL/DNA-directed RNA polymerase subunit M/transcription elongation factor TFIIS
MNNIDLLERLEFINNPEPRCPVLLLVDTSSSMSEGKIQEFNQGLSVFQKEISEDAKASRRAEIAIVTFGGIVNLSQDFVTVDDFHPFPLSVSGNTPMGQGIEYSLNLIEKRKQTYLDNGIDFYCPWLFLITNGTPTDSWDSAAQKIHEAEKRHELTFFSVGMEDTNMDTLKQLSTEHPPVLLKDINFTKMFCWLSNSVSSISSSSVGGEFTLPSINEWGVSEVQTLIKYIHKNGYARRFNPRVYKKLGIEVDERQWIETISMLVRSGQATEKLELTCPNCHEIINSYHKYQDIPLDQTIRCIHCTHEFKVSEEHIIPMYSFSDNFDPIQELSVSEKYFDSLAKKD